MLEWVQREREMQKLISMNEPSVRIMYVSMSWEVSMFGTSRGGDKFLQVLYNTVHNITTSISSREYNSDLPQIHVFKIIYM